MHFLPSLSFLFSVAFRFISIFCDVEQMLLFLHSTGISHYEYYWIKRNELFCYREHCPIQIPKLKNKQIPILKRSRHLMVYFFPNINHSKQPLSAEHCCESMSNCELIKNRFKTKRLLSCCCFNLSSSKSLTNFRFSFVIVSKCCRDVTEAGEYN